MTNTLADLYLQLCQAFEKQDWDPALKRSIAILQGAPDNFEARMKVADILYKLNRTQDALNVYKVVAWHFTKAGYPLLAIVAIKMLSSIDPSQADVLEVLADLYSCESDRVRADVRLPNLTRLDSIELTEAGQAVDQVIGLAGNELADLAYKLALDEANLPAYPEHLPPIPLFSRLPEEAFGQVLSAIKIRRLAADGWVIRQGDPGGSFYLLARGIVQVEKKVAGKSFVLAELEDGAVFGEMAMLSKDVRTASVRPLTHVELLELGAEQLKRLGEKIHSISVALRRFMQVRVLQNLFRLSDVFRSLPNSDREQLLEKFVLAEVQADQVIVEQDKPAMGLFVVLRGAVVVKQQEAGDSLRLATLKTGDVFGEISLLHDSPSVASVIAQTDSELLFLSKSAYDEHAKQYPALAEILAQVSKQRMENNAELAQMPEITDEVELVLL